ncbi:MAG: hypothetical protein AAGF81_09235 [Pseudomonadota bacterium]
MDRRDMLWVPLALAFSQGAWAHTPYGQWVVYRKKHLLIGSHRADPPTYAEAKRLAAVLAEHLPKSRSRVARAPTAGRLASLLGTDQLDVAVLSREDAVAMRSGQGKFAPYGKIPLALLASLGTYVLIAHERFPSRHAWLVSKTLSEAVISSDQAEILDWHPGTRMFLNGEPEPH